MIPKTHSKICKLQFRIPVCPEFITKPVLSPQVFPFHAEPLCSPRKEKGCKFIEIGKENITVLYRQNQYRLVLV